MGQLLALRGRFRGLPVTDGKDSEKAAATRGRPRRPRQDVRSKRVVTFLTESELQRLEDLAVYQDRSLSSVVHRIVTLYLNQTSPEY